MNITHRLRKSYCVLHSTLATAAAFLGAGKQTPATPDRLIDRQNRQNPFNLAEKSADIGGYKRMYLLYSPEKVALNSVCFFTAFE